MKNRQLLALITALAVCLGTFVLPVSAEETGQPEVRHVEYIRRSIYQNTAFEMPASVNVTMTDGTIQNMPVVWESTAVDVSRIGRTTYRGEIQKYQKKALLDLEILPMGTRGVVVDYWRECYGGSIDNIPLDTPPDESRMLGELAIYNGGGNYAAKAAGYVVPKETGEYTFYISADDAGAFYMSDSYKVENLKKLCETSSWTYQNSWKTNVSQKSRVMRLEAGKRYYFELLHKEATGDNHVSVGWSGPGIGKKPGESIEVVSGEYLKAFVSVGAPTNGRADDEANTFDFDLVAGHDDITEYEYSVDYGATWTPCEKRPVEVGNNPYIKGQVMVRVQETEEHAAGITLVSNAAYSVKREEAKEPRRETLWQLGTDDGLNTELGEITAAERMEVTVPDDWRTRTEWKAVLPKGMDLSKQGKLILRYHLEQVPENGVQFSVRVLDAYNSIPQLAVFSNDVFAGLIQIAGLGGTGSDLKYRYVYKLYIPAEMLKTGENVLDLSLDRGVYLDDNTVTTSNEYFWIDWDYVRLEKNLEPVSEPIHGRMTYLGTNVSSTSPVESLRTIDALKWLGIAYSGNMIRAGETGVTRELFTTLKAMNLTPVYIPIGFEDLQGETYTKTERYTNLVRQYGNLFEYLELSNEPGVFKASMAANLSLAQFVREIRSEMNPWMKLVAPGWAYWPTGGIPDGWAGDPAMRRQVEDLCDLTNGHSYGQLAVTDLNRGPVAATLKTYQDWYDAGGDGFPKELLLTETGSSNVGADNGKYTTEKHKHNSIFDRELRGDMAFSLGVMQHAITYAEGDNQESVYSVLQNMGTADINDLTAWVEEAEPDDNRVNSFRRLALAYATHGTPLKFTFNQPEKTAGKKAYFRAVDTAGLGVSNLGASSDKLLLNFVNFDVTDVDMDVNVQIPDGTYYAERYGVEATYGDAYSAEKVTVKNGGISLKESLRKGQAVQYILTPYEAEAPGAPRELDAQVDSYKQISLSWKPAADNVRVKEYRLYHNGEFVTQLPAAVTSFTHKGLAPESEHQYMVYAYDECGNRSEAAQTEIVTTFTMPTPQYSTKMDGKTIVMHIECENAEADGVAVNEGAARFYWGGQLNFTNLPLKKDQDYSITIKFWADGTAGVNVYVNGEYIKNAKMIKTAYGEASYVNVNLPHFAKEQNNIITLANMNNGNFVHLDWIEIKDAYQDETLAPSWRYETNESEYLYYSDPEAFTVNEQNKTTVCSEPGAFFGFGFKGNGFEWQTNTMGTAAKGIADVYVDGRLYKEDLDLSSAGEGTNKTVLKVDDLPDGVHSVKVVNKSGTISVGRMGYLTFELAPVKAGSDVIIKELRPSNPYPVPGEEISWTVVVENIGLLPTPDGIITGVGFSGANLWSDWYSKAIQPGEVVELYTNNGAQKTMWTAPDAGTYTIKATVDDINRYGSDGKAPEMTRDNNTTSCEILVRSPKNLSTPEERMELTPGLSQPVKVTGLFEAAGEQPEEELDVTPYVSVVVKDTGVAQYADGAFRAVSAGVTKAEISYAGQKCTVELIVN